MQLESLKNSLFALTATQAAAVVGGYVEEVEVAPGAGSFHSEDTFYLNGTVKTDKVQHD